MGNRTVSHLVQARCKSPRIGSPESRIEELAIEAQAMLRRHVTEAADLHNRLHAETRTYALRKAA